MEFIFEAIVDTVLETWTNLMKKRNPDYVNVRFRKSIALIVAIIMILVLVALFLGILFVIEWLFPQLFDVIRFN